MFSKFLLRISKIQNNSNSNNSGTVHNFFNRFFGSDCAYREELKKKKKKK